MKGKEDERGGNREKEFVDLSCNFVAKSIVNA